MKTFGYNNKFSSILRSLAAIAIGLVMIVATDATVTVVKIIAAFLFAAGVVSFAHGYATRKDGAMGLMLVNAVVDMAIGLFLFFCPTAVSGLVVVLIGIVVLVFGLIQLLAVAGTVSILGAGGFFVILSIIAVIGGITLIFSPFNARLMQILAGSFLIWYGVSDLLSMRRVVKAKTEYEIRFEKKQEESKPDDQSDTPVLDDVKDVEYQKIDEQ